MKKIIKIATLLVACIWIAYSCRPEDPTPVDTKPVGCPEMLDTRSKLYVNPYKGTLQTNSWVQSGHKYPELYVYSHCCVNPNNDYEIGYCRRNTLLQAGDDHDFFVYNFCTNTTKLIATNVTGWPDWSAKDWIAFTRQDRNIWKVKSNGDSLLQLTTTRSDYYAKWNKTGDKFIWNHSKLANENGVFLDNLNGEMGDIEWHNNNTIIGGRVAAHGRSFSIFEQNIGTKTKTHLATIPSDRPCYIGTISKNHLLFSVGNPDNSGTQKFYRLNLQNFDTTYLYTLPQSFLHLIWGATMNKLVVQQVLRDTMTGNPAWLNFRSHIAIMNLDGSNLRQVLLPE